MRFLLLNTTRQNLHSNRFMAGVVLQVFFYKTCRASCIFEKGLKDVVREVKTKFKLIQ